MDTNKTYREEYWKMAGNNEFFEALTMLEHERGITAEYLIEKIRAAIVIAVKKNYDVEDDNVSVEIDPATGVFNVALVQDVVADEDWENEHTQIPLSKAQTLRRTYQPGDRVVTPLKTKAPPRPPSTSSGRASGRPSAASSSARSSPRATTS